MNVKICNMLCAFALLAMSCSSEIAVAKVPAGKPSGEKPVCPWPMDSLFATPQYKVILERDGVKGIVYNGLDYKGSPKEIFAYYASPATLRGENAGAERYPAVVCVHGGNGYAFEEWARIWARRGFAAISMDLLGKRDGGAQLEHGYVGSPYITVCPDMRMDWFYQAVGDVVLANSLIRSFPEVDSTRTALTGISWGGVITEVLSGIDHRYKAYVPVYGSGYLAESGVFAGQLKVETELARQRWTRIYDPSLYVARNRNPMLFIVGTNDPAFFLDQWSKTYLLTDKRVLSLRVGMNHDHHLGWAPAEIYRFVENILVDDNSNPVPDLSNIKLNKGEIQADVTIPAVYDKVSLIYTCDNNPQIEKREWKSMPVEYKAGSRKITCVAPTNFTMCAFAVEDSNGCNFTTPILFGK